MEFFLKCGQKGMTTDEILELVGEFCAILRICSFIVYKINEEGSVK